MVNSAAFLLAINFSIGISFAAAFMALAWKSGIALGHWCGVGFLAASVTTVVEACAAVIPSPHLVSSLSFASLLLALTLVVAGLARHFGRPRLMPPLLAWWMACSLFNAAVVFYLKRGGWGQGIGYQMPFALTLALGCAIVLSVARKRAAPLILAVVLGLGSAQFVLKTVLSGLAGHGPDVRSYIGSAYAFYSQTAGCIFSILFGLALVGVIVAEMMNQSRQRF